MAIKIHVMRCIVDLGPELSLSILAAPAARDYWAAA